MYIITETFLCPNCDNLQIADLKWMKENKWISEKK